MSQKGKWVWQSLIICFFFNGILAGVLYWPFHEGLLTVNKYVQPVVSNQQLKKELPEEFSLLVSNLQELLNMLNQYGYMVLFAAIACVTLAMWIVLALVGRSRINKAIQDVKKEEPQVGKLDREPVTGVPKVDEIVDERRNLSAIQFIMLMQREGRFVDFLEEDISSYDDAQVGAAVKTLHDEWRKIFNEHVKIEHIYKEVEGTEVVVEEGFDASAIRLTGKVVGNPPFRGVIKHRGWKLVKIDLPRLVDSDQVGKKEFVLAPAEVEIQGSEESE